MSKYKIGEKIMGISTDMLGIRIVQGNVIDVIENKDPDMTRYVVDKGIIYKNDVIYDGETTEYDDFKYKQAKRFYEEAERLEKKAEELRDMAKTLIYSKNSKYGQIIKQKRCQFHTLIRKVRRCNSFSVHTKSINSIKTIRVIWNVYH